jgi:tetratricopeptide (TPR) repeat protein
MDELNEPAPKPNKRKIILYIALAVLVAAAIAYGIWRQTQDNTRYSLKQINGLPEEQRQDARKSEAENLEQEIKDLPADARGEQRYALYIKLAEIRQQLGEYDAAIAAVDKISPENQNNTRVWELYSSLYRAKGDIGKARASIRRALDIDGENVNDWVSFIELSKDVGDKPLTDLYNEALSKTHNNVNVVIAYAKALEDIGNLDGAVAQWQKALQLNPADKAVYDAQIKRLQGK